jgi:hypothetical protein
MAELLVDVPIVKGSAPRRWSMNKEAIERKPLVLASGERIYQPAIPYKDLTLLSLNLRLEDLKRKCNGMKAWYLLQQAKKLNKEKDLPKALLAYHKRVEEITKMDDHSFLMEFCPCYPTVISCIQYKRLEDKRRSKTDISKQQMRLPGFY